MTDDPRDLARRAIDAAKPPARFKHPHELDPAEHLHYIRTGDLPETEDYRRRRRQVLAEAGLADEGEDTDKPLDELTPDDHYRHLRERR